jgi:hypothetical protein
VPQLRGSSRCRRPPPQRTWRTRDGRPVSPESSVTLPVPDGSTRRLLFSGRCMVRISTHDIADHDKALASLNDQDRWGCRLECSALPVDPVPTATVNVVLNDPERVTRFRVRSLLPTIHIGGPASSRIRPSVQPSPTTAAAGQPSPHSAVTASALDATPSTMRPVRSVAPRARIIRSRNASGILAANADKIVGNYECT